MMSTVKMAALSSVSTQRAASSPPFHEESNLG